MSWGRLIQKHGINFLDGINVDRKVDIKKIEDIDWKIFNRNGRSILHYYLNNAEGECEVDVSEHTVIFTTTAESFGMSTTNSIEELATFVARQYNIPLESLICYEHYLKRDYIEEIVHGIQFEVREGVLTDPIFYKDELPKKFSASRC